MLWITSCPKGRQGFIQGTSKNFFAEAEAVIVDEVLLPSVPSDATSGFWAPVKEWIRSRRGGTSIRGGAWSIGGYVSTQVLRTVATLVLARHFLGPETFGLVGLVGVFVAGLGMFSELGILASVVQHPRGDDPKFLNTAFSIQAGRGLAIWVAATLAAYPIALFYKQPEIFPLLIVAALSEMVRGLTSTAAWTLTRHVNLRSITLLTLVSELAAFGVCVLWAAVSPTAWALVARTVATALVYAVGSHFIAKPGVHFGWDRSAAKDILHFGGWISIATATYFLGGQGERLILGKFITPAELGCFSLALMISTIPAGGISQLVSQIFLPLISGSVRTSQARTIRDFLRARQVFFAIALVAGVGFLVCAQPFVKLVLSQTIWNDWLDAAIAGPARGPGYFRGTYIQSYSGVRPDQILRGWQYDPVDPDGQWNLDRLRTVRRASGGCRAGHCTGGIVLSSDIRVDQTLAGCGSNGAPMVRSVSCIARRGRCSAMAHRVIENQSGPEKFKWRRCGFALLKRRLQQ